MLEQTYSKKCDSCHRYSRIEKSVQWYDRTDKNKIYYYCKRCFGAYWHGLIKMDRDPNKNIFIIKHAFGVLKTTT